MRDCNEIHTMLSEQLMTQIPPNYGNSWLDEEYQVTKELIRSLPEHAQYTEDIPRQYL
jgi:hypothetical protein